MKKSIIFEKSQTDWQRLREMKDEDIDLSDCPEVTSEMFAHAIARRGLKPVPRKAQLTLRTDELPALAPEERHVYSNASDKFRKLRISFRRHFST